MPPLTAALRRHRTDPERRSPKRGSVILYLMALALVPSIGLPVFAGLFAKDKVDEATAARRIGRAMTLAVDLHDLRLLVASESGASAMQYFLDLYGLTREQLQERIGDRQIIPLDTARAKTDDAFAALVPDDDTRVAFESLRPLLAEARRTADESFRSEGPTTEAGWALYEAFGTLDRKLSDIKLGAIQRVVTGYYGAGSSELLTAVAQLQRVTDTIDVGNEQEWLIQAIFSAYTDEQRTDVLAQLSDASATWRRSSAALPSHLSAELRATWLRVAEEADLKTFDETVGTLIGTRFDEFPSQLLVRAEEAANAQAIVKARISVLVHDAGAQGSAVAAADQAAAEHRTRLAMAGTLLLLLTTVALLVAIGGTLRSRLRGLAVAAERFSAGSLDDMPVQGPREISVASAALNDAAASFRRVAVQAERLSAGDLDAPELQDAAPGALGAAVHASVKRIVEAVREREKLREALAHQASHDDLTRLPNRAETERLLTRALARAQRSGSHVAVLFVDLDHFKQCNDRLGHAAGDHVLRTAAARMTAVVRPGDTVCRLGGDEFVVVVEPVGDDRNVVDIADRIATSLAEPIPYGDDLITVGGTVGIAVSDRESDADSLIREADSAMYQAKATERGGVEVFNENLRADLHRETEFRSAMIQALANGELELHYQPVLDVATGALTGFEALARWHRPGHGLVPPDQFIPLAERSGLIIDIGRWALDTAATQLAAWSEDPAYANLDVAVNLSGRHLAQAGVVDDVRAALTGSGLAPNRLVVEITESVAIDNPASVSHLAQLADIGVRIALDDFGTGYTSIGQLMHLPVHILKIDRSLISGTSEDGTPALEHSTRIVDLIVEIAHSLGLSVVAEGVETAAQLAKLAEASCERAQGYHLSRPIPSRDVTVWVRDRTAAEAGLPSA